MNKFRAKNIFRKGVFFGKDQKRRQNESILKDCFAISAAREKDERIIFSDNKCHHGSVSYHTYHIRPC